MFYWVKLERKSGTVRASSANEARGIASKLELGEVLEIDIQLLHI